MCNRARFGTSKIPTWFKYKATTTLWLSKCPSYPYHPNLLSTFEQSPSSTFSAIFLKLSVRSMILNGLSGSLMAPLSANQAAKADPNYFNVAESPSHLSDKS